MEDDIVRKTHAIKAPTPFEAAGKISQTVKLTKQPEGDWVRVTDEEKGLVFGYIPTS
ncbi:hypothetical protein DBIPINDM_008416 (plasmid) [Mesorhizobium sp. AR02]|uniref:hypothetical protein n=1 Tax=unclassified Mesorhizobium TaxID=325217 RepID=UPI002160CCE2|nr:MULTISPECIES: hypothetical protein [unclassified Mesorhizobium]UVK42003.1 hypothetical protein BPNPMPFG_003636 [Mesorhizobium sp. AR07]UVK57451.1 hypothetical protein DBIPINDM_008416 [Mesorhizobium sp. AR02]